MTLFVINHRPTRGREPSASEAANVFVKHDSRCAVCGGLLMQDQPAWYYSFPQQTVFAHQACLKSYAAGIALDLVALLR